MLTWDLSDTPLARTNEPVRGPNEAQLFVLLAAMLLDEGVAYSELRDRPLVLTSHNREHIAEIIEWCLSPLSRDTGTGQQLRQRLRMLDGAVVMLVPQQEAAVVAGKEHT